jgi:hypothetical protein
MALIEVALPLMMEEDLVSKSWVGFTHLFNPLGDKCIFLWDKSQKSMNFVIQPLNLSLCPLNLEIHIESGASCWRSPWLGADILMRIP